MLWRCRDRLIAPAEPKPRLGAYAAAAGSGLLMAAAFPPLEWRGLIWIGLIPLLWAVRNCSPRRAASLGFLAGVVFWHLSLAWLQKVTTAGWIGLALYCALYPAAFAGLYAAVRERIDPARWPARLGIAAAATAIWTGLEYLRSTLFTGFPWNGLGISQYPNIRLIQSAAWGGVFGVSALIVWVNACLAVSLEPRPPHTRRKRTGQPGPESIAAAVAVVAALGYGQWELARLPAPDQTVRLALVQPAIPQYVKWTESFVAETYRRLETLSEAALAAKPDLLVWPETAIADVLRASPDAYALVRRVTGHGVPLLVGALDEERGDEGTVHYFNSAFLIEDDGSFGTIYDKRHLVLFGEYVPFSRRFPWLRSLSPIESDVTPGREPILFPIPSSDTKFGVLICFEDTLPYLARELAAEGAHLFITLTNDAWFDFTSGPRQHLAQSIFRCVEQRRPMARCANSGVTAWIDAAGRIGGTDGSGPGILPHSAPGPKTLSGFLLAEIPLHSSRPPPTLHARFGDVFGRVCALTLVFPAILLVRRRTRTRKEKREVRENQPAA